MSHECRECGSPDGCENCGLCWNCGPPCVDGQTTILHALSEGSATTWDVQQELREQEMREGGANAPQPSMDRVRSRLRILEARGLIDHIQLLGPPGFCTFEWFLTDKGSAALATTPSPTSEGER